MLRNTQRSLQRLAVYNGHDLVRISLIHLLRSQITIPHSTHEPLFLPCSALFPEPLYGALLRLTASAAHPLFESLLTRDGHRMSQEALRSTH